MLSRRSFSTTMAKLWTLLSTTFFSSYGFSRSPPGVTGRDWSHWLLWNGSTTCDKAGPTNGILLCLLVLVQATWLSWIFRPLLHQSDFEGWTSISKPSPKTPDFAEVLILLLSGSSFNIILAANRYITWICRKRWPFPNFASKILHRREALNLLPLAWAIHDCNVWIRSNSPSFEKNRMALGVLEKCISIWGNLILLRSEYPTTKHCFSKHRAKMKLLLWVPIFSLEDQFQ